MKKFDKLNLYLEWKNYKYDKRCDEIIDKIINEATFVKINEFYAIFTIRDKKYGMWIANFPYASLSHMVEFVPVPNNEGVRRIDRENFIYYRVRPSRKQELRFWDWLTEKSKISNFNYYDIRSMIGKKHNKDGIDKFLERNS